MVVTNSSALPLVRRAVSAAVHLDSTVSNTSEASKIIGDHGSQWSPEALEKAGSGLKALNRMAKCPPVHLMFEDLSYTVTSNKGEQTILHNISGEFRPGELTCILGPSGAGKSTLLNIVAGYYFNGVTGKITVNGRPRESHLFKKLSTYIMQEDLLQPRLSVIEAMRIAADLKLGKDLKKPEKELIVKEILQILGLWDHRSTMTECLSGGQLKRLSMALELVNNPPVIFLDEPTTGLDVVSIKQLVVLLQLLSRQGRTIICTVHQPSASLFGLFDRIYILAKGMCCYQGTPQLLVSHLAEAGFICPTNHNPADFVMETLQNDMEGIINTSELCQNGKLIRQLNGTLSDEKYSILNVQDPLEEVFVELTREQTLSLDFPTSFWIQFCVLSKRMFIQNKRNSVGLFIQISFYLGSALLISGLFYNVGNNATLPDVNFKFCLCCLVFSIYTNVMTPVLLFPMQVQLLKREYFNRWYGLKAYYAALTLSNMPLMFVLDMLFLFITFVMSGQILEWDRLLLFSLNGFICAICSEGFGLVVGAACSVTNGSIIAPAMSAPLLVLSCYGLGFGPSIEKIMRYLMSLSYMRYGVAGFSIALYQNREPIECPDIFCLYANPKLVLRDIGMESDAYWTQIIALIGFTILHRVIAYVVLKYRLTVEFSSKYMNYISKCLKHR